MINVNHANDYAQRRDEMARKLTQAREARQAELAKFYGRDPEEDLRPHPTKKKLVGYTQGGQPIYRPIMEPIQVQAWGKFDKEAYRNAAANDKLNQMLAAVDAPRPQAIEFPDLESGFGWDEKPTEGTPEGMYTYQSTISYSVSPASCGIRVMQSIGYKCKEDIFKDLVKHLKQFWMTGASYIYGRKGSCYPAGVFQWCDRADGSGDEFGQWMQQRFPNKPPLCIRQTNPASGRQVAVYMWELPDEIRQTDEWTKLHIPATEKYVQLPR